MKDRHAWFSLALVAFTVTYVACGLLAQTNLPVPPPDTTPPSNDQIGPWSIGGIVAAVAVGLTWLLRWWKNRKTATPPTP